MPTEAIVALALSGLALAGSVVNVVSIRRTRRMRMAVPSRYAVPGGVVTTNWPLTGAEHARFSERWNEAHVHNRAAWHTYLTATGEIVECGDPAQCAAYAKADGPMPAEPETDEGDRDGTDTR